MSNTDSTCVNNDRSLLEWVDYIQTLHHREIELSLDRVRQVYQRLYPQGLSCKIISVAGTNGKGSTAELLSSIYLSAGYNVGKFTSPHLIDFAERYSINGQNADQDALLQAFRRIESTRADIPITFFEFGALLAIELFAVAEVDIAIMEVGLGGRLDATNILDADVSVITSISIDHTAWLGNSIEKIAYEKVGIARSDKPCVVGIEQPPTSIIDYCKKISANLSTIGNQFNYSYADDARCWQWHSKQRCLDNLPLPYSQSGVQLSNAAVAIEAIDQLDRQLPVSDKAIAEGLASASILARCQIVSQQPLVVLDVAHNESSIIRLRNFIEQQSYSGKLVVVCGMLQDKEITKSLACIESIVSEWHIATIDNERGASAEYLRQQIESINHFDNQNSIHCYQSIQQAYQGALEKVTDYDSLLVFGSFFVVGDILELLKNN